MGLENKFSDYNRQNNQPKLPEGNFRQSEKGISRRRTLFGLGALGLGLINRDKIWNFLSNSLSKKDKDKIKDSLDLIEKLLSPASSVSPERKLIEEEDRESIQKILNFHQRKICLDSTEIKKVENFWRDRYQHYPPLRRSFEKAYFEMGAWQGRLRKIFQKELSKILPLDQINDLIYLAIPESHWQIYYWQNGSRSSKGAVGPYQIIRSMARKYGLRVDRVVDERRDPELSADACARIIKDLLKDFDNNLDLAISGYNGSFVYQYRKDNHRRNMSYDDFLSYTAKRINQLKKELDRLKYYHYRVQKGDTFRKISLIARVPIQKLANINGLKNKDTIRIGQEIKIPLSESAKEKLFACKISGFEENLVYPAKYKAIVSLIHQGLVGHDQQEKPLNFRTITIKYLVHVIRKGETIYSLSRRYYLPPKQIVQANPGINIKQLVIGRRLLIPSSNSTLAKISHHYHQDLSRLKKLNPAVIKMNALLPEGFKVRI